MSNATASGTATILDHVVYDRYGNIVSQSNSGNDIRQGFTGYLQDAETGLNYANARYYQPATGTFISVDPAGFGSGTYNLYGYVDQAPTNGTDPSGLVASTGNNVLFYGLGSPVLSNTQQTISPTFASTLLGSKAGTGAAIDWGHGTIVSEPANTDSISQLAATYDGSPTSDGSSAEGMGIEQGLTSALSSAPSATQPPTEGALWDKWQGMLDQQSADSFGSLASAQQLAENGPISNEDRFQKPINQDLSLVQQLQAKMVALSNRVEHNTWSDHQYTVQFEAAGGVDLEGELAAAQTQLKEDVDFAKSATQREAAGGVVTTYESGPQATPGDVFVQWDNELRQSILNSGEQLINGFAAPIHQAGSDIYTALTGGVRDNRPYTLIPYYQFQQNFSADPNYPEHIQTMTNYASLAESVALIFASLPDSSVPVPIDAAESVAEQPKWNLGDNKSAQKWQNQMQQRGWTPRQIDDAIANGQKFDAPNNINPGNGATRFLNSQTGRSVVVDNKTGQVIHVGGDGFKY